MLRSDGAAALTMWPLRSPGDALQSSEGFCHDVRLTRLLVVEDDADLRSAMRLFLDDEGYEVVEAANGELAIDLVATERIDLVLLDLRLPGISGLDVCRTIRRDGVMPIIIVSARSDSHDLVAGLEAGADDYIVKPVVPHVMAARIRALLRRLDLDRRATPRVGTIVGDIDIRPVEGVVLRAGVSVALTRTEFALLCTFAEHPNQVMSRDQLLERVWGYEYIGDGRLVDSHIRRLRTKIETDPDHPIIIVTVRGLGYRFTTR